MLLRDMARAILNWLLIPAPAIFISTRVAAGINHFGAHAWVAQSGFGWIYIVGLTGVFLAIAHTLYAIAKIRCEFGLENRKSDL